MEQQQEEASSQVKHGQILNAEQITAQQRRRGLELDRQRIRQQMERTENPQYREMLQAAMAEVEAKIARDE